MKSKLAAPLLITLALSTGSIAGHAQTATNINTEATPLTRSQVRMETAEFLKTHRWEDASDNWVLKSGYEPPVGVKTRAEVRAERDKFLMTHHWTNVSGWLPVTPEPRDYSGKTREQVASETRTFMSTHSWDEFSQSWKEVRPHKAN